MNVRQYRTEIRGRAAGTFAPAWREFYRRRNIVRTLWVASSLYQLFVFYPYWHDFNFGAWLLVMFSILAPVLIMNKPFIALFLVSALGYSVVRERLHCELTPAMLHWWVWAIGTWVAIALVEVHFYNFRCPNCKRRYFSYALKSTGDERHCEHCGTRSGALYKPD